MSGTYTITDLARLVRRPPDWLYRKANRAELEARGFPPPLPVPGRPMVWSAARVDAWIEAAPGAPGAASTPAVDELDRRDRLAKRARTIGLREGTANDR